ncbi:hypothetical protein SAMN02746041_03018 [Desulfacinum hydrothermale DSM 13146]|uniref:Uncharacterized protein n=2 Tax=Desulfacinum hydrothermale TaxID=109258 RepID=A0A1W1XVP2_9BACT|nr:hypothetical protein SAMN02746041_03018 [Desulfacinum hydrothermale DSM 13146]
MSDELEKEYEKSHYMAQRHFRKDVGGFRDRRRLELEDLLRVEQEKPEDLQDKDKIQWILDELAAMQDEPR